MNFLKQLVAFDVRGVRRGLSLRSSLVVLYSVRKDWLGLGCGGSRDPIESPYTHLMGGYQAKGGGHSSSIIWKRCVLDLRSGSGDILWRRPSWIRIHPAPIYWYIYAYTPTP